MQLEATAFFNALAAYRQQIANDLQPGEYSVGRWRQTLTEPLGVDTVPGAILNPQLENPLLEVERQALIAARNAQGSGLKRGRDDDGTAEGSDPKISRTDGQLTAGGGIPTGTTPAGAVATGTTGPRPAGKAGTRTAPTGTAGSRTTGPQSAGTAGTAGQIGTGMAGTAGRASMAPTGFTPINRTVLPPRPSGTSGQRPNILSALDAAKQALYEIYKGPAPKTAGPTIEGVPSGAGSTSAAGGKAPTVTGPKPTTTIKAPLPRPAQQVGAAAPVLSQNDREAFEIAWENQTATDLAGFDWRMPVVEPVQDMDGVMGAHLYNLDPNTDGYNVHGSAAIMDMRDRANRDRYPYWSFDLIQHNDATWRDYERRGRVDQYGNMMDNQGYIVDYSGRRRMRRGQYVLGEGRWAWVEQR